MGSERKLRNDLCASCGVSRWAHKVLRHVFVEPAPERDDLDQLRAENAALRARAKRAEQVAFQAQNAAIELTKTNETFFADATVASLKAKLDDAERERDEWHKEAIESESHRAQSESLANQRDRAWREAADPFVRCYRVSIEPFGKPDDEPIRALIPGAWPKVGDLRRLAALLDEPESAGPLNTPCTVTGCEGPMSEAGHSPLFAPEPAVSSEGEMPSGKQRDRTREAATANTVDREFPTASPTRAATASPLCGDEWPTADGVLTCVLPQGHVGKHGQGYVSWQHDDPPKREPGRRWWHYEARQTQSGSSEVLGIEDSIIRTVEGTFYGAAAERHAQAFAELLNNENS